MKRFLTIVTSYLFENSPNILINGQSSILHNSLDLEPVKEDYMEGFIDEGDLVYQFELKKVYQVTTIAELAEIDMDKIILGHNDPTENTPTLKKLKN